MGSFGMGRRPRGSLRISVARRWLVPATVWLLVSAGLRAGLDEYIRKPDSSYSWKLKNKVELSTGVVYDLELISQTWQGITWTHQLQVYQPSGVSPAATMLIYVTGGKANPANMLFGTELAKGIGAPVAVLYDIPNQPLLGNKREDALIAETFVRYLESKDENWPLLFPMVKSVIRAMDTLQAFSEQTWGKKVEKFVISGGSKRGWTTWLTAATGDPRVKAIAPLVIDMLNLRLQMSHQVECFGTYSEMIRDYTERKLVPMPDTEEARRLWAMVDPWVYRERLTQPKLIVNGANDPYWTVDALNLYWDDLPGDKWVLIVPNAGHDLMQRTAAGRDRSRALTTLAAFVRHYTLDNPMPRMTWQHKDADGQHVLCVSCDQQPKGARLWVARAPTLDFRKATWEERVLPEADKQIEARLAPPGDGFMAFYAELDFSDNGTIYRLSTQLRVVGKGRKENASGK